LAGVATLQNSAPPWAAKHPRRFAARLTAGARKGYPVEARHMTFGPADKADWSVCRSSL